MQIARKIYVRIIIPQSVVRAAAAARSAGGERIHRFAVERMTFEERLHYARRVAPPDGMADENRGAVLEIFRLACDRGAGVGIVLLTASAAAAVRIIEIGGGVRRFWNDLIQRTAVSSAIVSAIRSVFPVLEKYATRISPDCAAGGCSCAQPVNANADRHISARMHTIIFFMPVTPFYVISGFCPARMPDADSANSPSWKAFRSLRPAPCPRPRSRDSGPSVL